MSRVELSKEDKKSIESYCRRMYGLKFTDLKYSEEASAYSCGIPVFLSEVPVKELLMTRKKYRAKIFETAGAFVRALPLTSTKRPDAPSRKAEKKKVVFIIFINTDMGWGKKNRDFSFWHEVGHIANRDLFPLQRKNDKRSDLQREIDADQFATEKMDYSFKITKWGMSRGERDFARTYLIAEYPELLDNTYGLEFVLNRMMKKRRLDVHNAIEERIRRQNALVDEHKQNLLLDKAG